MKAYQAECEIIDRIVRQVFGYLTDMGYRYEGTTITEMALIGVYVEAIFRNTAIKRELQIAYLPAVPGSQDALSVSLCSGSSEMFTLVDFMRTHSSAPHEVNRVILHCYEGSLSDRVTGCLSAVRTALDQYLKDTLSGIDWPHVPVDWGDQK